MLSPEMELSPSLFETPLVIPLIGQTITLSGKIKTNYPDMKCEKIAWKINSSAWCGFVPCSWLCVEASYTIDAGDKDEWLFTFEFLSTTEISNDEIDLYERVDFNLLFPLDRRIQTYVG
jgi:hypothetical protein